MAKIKNRFVVLICFILLAVLLSWSFSCYNNQEKLQEPNGGHTSLLDSNNHKRDFDSMMSIICKDTSALEFSKELLADSNFIIIYEHSSSYLDDAIALLSKQRVNEKRAIVCVYAMQHLSPIEYVRFCQFYLRLYDDKKIGEGMLRETIFPNFGGKWIIAENYKDPDVMALLHKLEDSKTISGEFKMEVENILSGKTLRGLRS
jgi:hypothetical protein